MSRRLLLDTSVLVGAERGQLHVDRMLHDDDDVAIAAVTAAQLLAGVELADTERREARRTRVDELLTALPVEPYDLRTAVEHARLLAHVKRAGRPRGAHDLMIAATAVQTGRAVVTGDASAAWEQLPNVELVPVPPSSGPH